MKTITLKLPDTLDHRLTHFAGLQKASSKSAVVRQAIEFYLSVSPQSAEPSAAVMATKWLGLLKGPADLSTHTKHLDDIGRRSASPAGCAQACWSTRGHWWRCSMPSTAITRQ